MCNLYSMTKHRAAIVALTRAMEDRNNNQPPLPAVFPDYLAPVVLQEDGVRVVRDMRWGLPSSKKALLDAATKRANKLREKGKAVDFDHLLRMEPDEGTVAPSTITRLEGGEELKARTVEAVQQALEASGMIFIDENGEGPGVRLRKPR